MCSIDTRDRIARLEIWYWLLSIQHWCIHRTPLSKTRYPWPLLPNKQVYESLHQLLFKHPAFTNQISFYYLIVSHKLIKVCPDFYDPFKILIQTFKVCDKPHSKQVEQLKNSSHGCAQRKSCHFHVFHVEHLATHIYTMCYKVECCSREIGR